MPHRDDVPPTGPCAAQLGAFLFSRRARLTPRAVGLPHVGRRRTAGLRREEVAQLAGISAAWYTHLEQGRDVHPSREVLGALADGLRLDATERAHLFRLAYGPRRDAARHGPAGAASPFPAALPPPSLLRLLEALEPAPALAIDRCWDLVCCNAVLLRVLPDLDPLHNGRAAPPGGRRVNLVEYVLTSATFRAGMCDWAQVARLAVDGLRASLASVGAAEALRGRAEALVGRLNATSAEFRTWWPAQGLWVADRPVTHVYEHPEVGRLKVDGSMLDVRSAPGLALAT